MERLRLGNNSTAASETKAGPDHAVGKKMEKLRLGNNVAAATKSVPDAIENPVKTITSRKKLGRVGRKKARAKGPQLYISLVAPVDGCWYKIDVQCIPKATNAAGTNIKAVHEMDFPNETCNYIPSTGCACVNSKIYVTGGYLFPCSNRRDRYTTKMSIYDVCTKTWDHNHGNMQLPRGYHMAIAIHSRIFVFGGRSNGGIPREKWGEIYDTKSQTWEFLPSPPPQELADSPLQLHAVYDNQNQILLWTNTGQVYSYNYDTHTWIGPSDYSYISQIPTLFPFAHTVAVVDDTMFWHYCGDIYAYDLINKRSLEPSHSLDRSYSTFAESRFGYREQFDPSFLLRLGKDTLLFLYFDYGNKTGQNYQCYRFRIIRETDAHGAGSPSLVPDGCGLFNISGYDLSRMPDVEVKTVTPKSSFLVAA